MKKDKSTALVAQSGGGKSTCLQLIQRFYDPLNAVKDDTIYNENEILTGKAPPGVYFDGYNLKSLNPIWLRKQIGVVSQEPNLFDMSIKENIMYGRNDLDDVPMQDIIDAARCANAHDFIMTLPDKYDCQVGEKGSKLSGGQKQRVAIARALLRKPKLLLLDEATSALDNESERVVQEALNEITSEGTHTNIIVAHRLNTIENADEIIVLKEGKEVESGSVPELLAKKGAFFDLHNVETI